MRFFAAALIFFGVAASYAQTPEVPHKINFAGMSLTIRDDARREIQQDVEALTRSARYFDMKVERAKTYFPIIEKIFEEENLPQDFKYLCLQESALVPDAVSVSNAVGFWQFKDFTAVEMGLRVDNVVDERMNIVSASRGAARYLKQSNTYFDNWLLSLQSYQMGPGAVRRAMGEKYKGHSHMEISSETYWYIKKYLAHKIAFENAVQGSPQVKVNIYAASNRPLSHIANEASIDEAVLREYNKWARQGHIPGDKTYSVVVPSGNILPDFNNLVMQSSKASRALPLAKASSVVTPPVINGLETIIAKAGENVSALAERAHVDVSKFIAYNDMPIDEEIKAGKVYFIHRKKKSNDAGTYKTKLGEDLWSISQQVGVRLKNLRRLNPDIGEGLVPAGTTIRLSKNAPVIAREVPATTPQPRIDTPPSTPAPLETTDADASAPDGVVQLSQETFSWSPVIESKPTSAPVPTAMDSVKQTPTIPSDTVKQESVVAKDTTTEVIHIVRASDTLYSIARRYGATIKEVMEWNHKTVLSVSVGEKLRILKR